MPAINSVGPARDAAPEAAPDDDEWIATGANPATTTQARPHVSRRRIYMLLLALAVGLRIPEGFFQGMVAVPGIEPGFPD